MKLCRETLFFVNLCVAFSAMYLLWGTGDTNSLLVLMLIAAPLVISLILALSATAKVMGHRDAFGPNHQRAVLEVTGGYEKWRPFHYAGRACTVTAAVWMIYTGNGLRGCGEVFAAAFLTYQLLDWLDTTKAGRKLAHLIHVPLTPEGDLTLPPD